MTIKFPFTVPHLYVGINTTKSFSPPRHPLIKIIISVNAYIHHRHHHTALLPSPLPPPFFHCRRRSNTIHALLTAPWLVTSWLSSRQGTLLLLQLKRGLQRSSSSVRGNELLYLDVGSFFLLSIPPNSRHGDKDVMKLRAAFKKR
jgi:hypothetical protein